ncbi:MAG: helix-turn-helix domain-containing protein [Acidimicrobiales bacterium]
MRLSDLPPFLRVEQAQELTQLGRTQIYEQARRFLDTGGREGIPAVRFGRCVRIPTAALLAMAGLDDTAGSAGDGR